MSVDEAVKSLLQVIAIVPSVGPQFAGIDVGACLQVTEVRIIMRHPVDLCLDADCLDGDRDVFITLILWSAAQISDLKGNICCEDSLRFPFS